MTSGKRTPACRRLLSDADDATDDNHNTAKEFYMQEVERFKGKWNFDPTTGRPVPGNYRWQGSEEQEVEEEKKEEEEGVDDDVLKGRHGRFESNAETSRDAEERNDSTFECESSTGNDSRPTPTSSTRVDSQLVIVSLETESNDVKASPVTSLNAASADLAPLTIASRDAEASADWSKSSASVSADSSDVIDQKSSSSTSSMTSVDESSSSEIPVTSGTHLGDEEEAGDTRRRLREIKGQSSMLV